MTSYDDWKATDVRDAELGSNPQTSSEWFYARLAEKDKEIERFRSLIPLAFSKGIETACDFYDNGMPKSISATALDKFERDNGLK